MYPYWWPHSISSDRHDVFIRNYIFESSNQLDAAYLKLCNNVIMFKDTKGRYVAGFVINCSRPYRYLDGYTPEQKNDVLENKGIKTETDLCEIACIWFASDRAIKISEKYKKWIFVCALCYAFRTDTKYVIGGSVVPFVWKRFKLVLKNQLFLGIVFVKDDKDKSELGAVFYQRNGWRLWYHFMCVLFKTLFKKLLKKLLKLRFNK